MINITGISKPLCLTFLVAALILPKGINNLAMANNGLKIKHTTPIRSNEIACDKEESYSISAIKIFDWI